MSEPDWKIIEIAIRERKFDDLAPEVWDQVADKIKTFVKEKRGSKNKESLVEPVDVFIKKFGFRARGWFKFDTDVTLQENTDRWFSHFLELLEWEMSQTSKLTVETCYQIENTYYQLRTQGVKAVKAKILVAELYKLKLGHKSIEAILTAISHHRMIKALKIE
jgi:hypothetical protein